MLSLQGEWNPFRGLLWSCKVLSLQVGVEPFPWSTVELQGAFTPRGVEPFPWSTVELQGAFTSREVEPLTVACCETGAAVDSPARAG